MLLIVCLGCSSNKSVQTTPINDNQTGGSDSVVRPQVETTGPAEIIRAAIEAHGGESNFAKTYIGKTVMTVDGAFQQGVSGQFTKTDIFHLPSKMKRLLKGKSQGEQFEMKFVVSDGKSWAQVNGGEPITSTEVNQDLHTYPSDSLAILVALLGPDFELSVLPSDDLKGHPVHRVRLENSGNWVGDNFFDKETHLLVASKKELFDSSIQKTRSIETYYSAYKKVDGLNLPMAIDMIMDGEVMSKIKVTEVTFMDHIDEGEFAALVVER
ncbi:MAG: hypothetical protein ACR2FY_04040 [Pirellulaceae bacterium]